MSEKTAEIEIPPNYVTIDENEYKVKTTVHEIESMPCQCSYKPGESLDNACGEYSDCMNRMLLVECRPDECPCEGFCQNQRFQKKQYPSVEVFKAEGKGFGLRAGENLGENHFIMEYVGEVVSQTSFMKRIQKLGPNDHFYFMTLKSDMIIDASNRGNLSRFINHSCNPNCATQKWIVDGQMRIGIFTLKPILKGTELTFDYKFERYGTEPQKCLCGEPQCNGYIGVSKKSNNNAAASDVYDDEDEEDDEPEAFRKSAKSENGIEDRGRLAILLKKMLQTDNAKKILKYLRKLELTESKDVLNRFTYLHGLKILQVLLKDYKDELEVIRSIFRILDKIPIPNRNVVEDLRLDKQVSKHVEHSDVIVSMLAKKILHSFTQLEKVYKIPKIKEAKKPEPARTKRSLNGESPGQVQERRPVASSFFLESPNEIKPDEGSSPKPVDSGSSFRSPAKIKDENVYKNSPSYQSKAAYDSSTRKQPYKEDHSRIENYSRETKRYDSSDYYRKDNNDTNGKTDRRDYNRNDNASDIHRTYSNYNTPVKKEFNGHDNGSYSTGGRDKPKDRYTRDNNYKESSYKSTSAYNARPDYNSPSYSASGPSKYSKFDGKRNEGNDFKYNYDDASSKGKMNEPSAAILPPKPLPKDWNYAYSPDGQIYYYHMVTQETQWEFPEDSPMDLPKKEAESTQVYSNIEGVSHSEIQRIIQSATNRSKVVEVAEPKKIESKKMPIEKSFNMKDDSFTRPKEKSSPHVDDKSMKKVKDQVRAGSCLFNDSKIVEFVVKYLSKYKDSFPDVANFKNSARLLSHSILDKEKRKNPSVSNFDDGMRSKAKVFLKDWLIRKNIIKKEEA